VPYLYSFPNNFALVCYAKVRRYCLINKDWAELKPCLSDLFYHYHIVKAQSPIASCEDVSGYLNFLKFINNLDEHVENSIRKFRISVCKDIFNDAEVHLLCNLIINAGVYYWGDFEFLLQKRYHLVWIECYQLALQKGSEQERDLKLISDRYEFDLNTYLKKGNSPKNLSENFQGIKQKFGIEYGTIEPLHFLTLKKIYCDQIAENKNLIKEIFNDTSLMKNLFGSYLMFKNESIIKYYYENDKKFMSEMFHEHFEKKYKFKHFFKVLNLEETEAYMISEDIYYWKDFIHYMHPLVLEIIKQDSFSNEQMKLLFYYVTAVFHYGDDLGLFLTRDIPSSFNSQFEDYIFSTGNQFYLIPLQKFLKKVRKAQYRNRSEKFNDKLLSLKRIIISICKHEKQLIFLFFFSMWLFFESYTQKSPSKSFGLILSVMLSLMSLAPFLKLCHARFVY
jgi:hypothetical protein